ncbi:MAG TPA: hypothetical protein VKZ76_08605 [Edaphocola sp.]|nr:hypothetical protein [Edaphocola sp.]
MYIKYINSKEEKPAAARGSWALRGLAVQGSLIATKYYYKAMVANAVHPTRRPIEDTDLRLEPELSNLLARSAWYPGGMPKR